MLSKGWFLWYDDRVCGEDRCAHLGWLRAPLLVADRQTLTLKWPWPCTGYWGVGSGGTGIGTVQLPLRVPLAAPLLPRPTKQLSLFDSKVIRPHTLIADARNDVFSSYSGIHPWTSSLMTFDPRTLPFLERIRFLILMTFSIFLPDSSAQLDTEHDTTDMDIVVLVCPLGSS